MRLFLLLIFVLFFGACNQHKSPRKLSVLDIKYSGYRWHFNPTLNKFEFYLDHYIDIDEYGHFVFMNQWRSPKYFSGNINDVIWKQIDSLTIKKYNRNYNFKPGNIIYDGLTYCIDYKRQDSSRTMIRYIPEYCPNDIRLLSSLLDSLIDTDSLHSIELLDVKTYTDELATFDTSFVKIPRLRMAKVVFKPHAIRRDK
jgi:hypothetical protein